ncbi:hypothetical protein ACYULU_03180 [Breznakiellaceae bacterium SP9]
MKNLCVRFGFIWFLFLAAPSPFAECQETKQGFDLSLVWALSLENALNKDELEEGGLRSVAEDANLSNRLGLALKFPWASLSLRGEALDKRPVSPTETQLPTASVGLYHQGTGSRLLFGTIEQYGLARRLQNTWAHSVPFPELHTPQSMDLKTTPTTNNNTQSAIYLSSLPLYPIQFYGLGLIDSEDQLSLGIGAVLTFAPKINLSIDGFYTEKTLPERKAATWFSANPPLPSRDFNLYALALGFNSPSFALSTDAAFTNTFALGSGMYLNGGLRIGNKPWRLSLAADGADFLFAGRDGSVPGAAFRLAGKLERRGVRNGLFRAQSALRAPAYDEAFRRSKSSLSYRFPSLGKDNQTPVSLSRVSLDAARNAENPAKVLDSYHSSISFNAGPFKPLLSAGLNKETSRDMDADSFLQVFPQFQSGDENTLNLSAQISYTYGSFLVRLRGDYEKQTEKAAIWGGSLYGSVRGKAGRRLSLKIGSTELPVKWNYTLSWRLVL